MFLVDTNKFCFVWVGGRASPTEKKSGLGYAHVRTQCAAIVRPSTVNHLTLCGQCVLNSVELFYTCSIVMSKNTGKSLYDYDMTKQAITNNII